MLIMTLALISNETNLVRVLLSHIIINYFANNSHATCILQTQYSDFDTLDEFDMHPLVLVQLQPDGSLMEKILKSRIDIGCQSFIVTEELFQVFLNSFQNIKDDCEQRLLEVYVITLWEAQNDNVFIQMILRHSVISELPNILILQQTDESTFNLFTIEIHTKYNVPTLVLLDEYNPATEKFRQNSDLFPKNKLRNLNQKAVKLSTFNYQPYAIWKSVPPGEGNANTVNSSEDKDIWVDGTEIMVFLEFCKQFNCTLTMFTDDVYEWGEIFENNTGNGVIGAVYENTVDVGVGALYTWYAVYLHLAISKPITRTGITCFVLKPKLKSRFFMPIYPFAYDLWIAVVASMIFSAIVVKYVKMMQRKINAYNLPNKKFGELLLDIYKIYLLQSIDLVSDHTAIIMVVGCILLIGLMMGNAYSGGLASVMTVPVYEQAIEKVQQLADSDLDWAATHDAWIFSIQSATNPILVKLVDKFHTYPKEVLAERMEQANLAFSIERLPYGHFAIGEYITENGLENYQIMLEDIYWEMCVAISSKTWSLLPLLDDLILRIVESGIQKYWELIVVMKHANNKVQLMAATHNKHHENDDPISLKVSHLFGVFGILMTGLLISTGVFIGEILFNNIHK